jgi:hypothetical protein
MSTRTPRRPCRPRLAVEQLEARDQPSVSVFVSVLGGHHRHHGHVHQSSAGVSVNVRVVVGPFVGIQISI